MAVILLCSASSRDSTEQLTFKFDNNLINSSLSMAWKYQSIKKVKLTLQLGNYNLNPLGVVSNRLCNGCLNARRARLTSYFSDQNLDSMDISIYSEL